MQLRLRPILALFLLIFGSCGNTENQKTTEASPSTPDTISTTVTASPDPALNDTVPAAKAPDSVLLRFNLTPGKQYAYTLVTDMEQEMQERKMGNKMRWMFTVDVQKGTGALKTLLTTYRQIDMEINMNGGKLQFSSETPPSAAAGPMAAPGQLFAAVKGKSFTMQVNPKGEIVSVQGFDKIAESVIGQMNLPEEKRAAMMQNFQKQFSDETVRQMFSQAFTIYPDRAVRVGDSWEKETVSLDRNPQAKIQYTVKEIKGNRVTLSGRTRAPLNETATLQVNARTGLVMDATFRQNVSGARSMQATTRITAKEQ